MPIERTMQPFLPQEIPQMGQIDEEISVTTMLDDGGALIDFNTTEQQPQHDDNLAEFMDESALSSLAMDLIQDFEADKQSRADWEKAYVSGLDLMGLKFEDRTIPWAGACGVFHPMLADSVVRFQAQTIQEVFPAGGPARTAIAGTETPEKLKQALRVEKYLNYVTTEEMVEYRNETEKLLFSLPLAGSAFRKIYYDHNMGRPCSMFVPAEDFVVSYGAAELSTCERATHVMKRTQNWVRKMQVSGFYRDIDLLEPTPDMSEIQNKYNKLTGESESMDVDSRHVLLEMQVDVDLDEYEKREEQEIGELNIKSGIALPYVITIDKSSREILAIRRNWVEQDPIKLKRDHVVHYQYLPGLGFYGFGLIHMIGGLAKSSTSILRMLVDAGTLANLPGGLKTRGLHIWGDDSPIMPGEFRDVDVPSGAIGDNITFLPNKEPSMVLYQLLTDLVNEGRRFASAADVKAADMNAEAPVGTTLAILEREMKVMSAVQARIHASMGKELRILARIIKENGPERYPYEVDGEFTIAEDFDNRVDIIPVSDPNAGTMAQRIMQYQAALQLASQAPQMYDMPLLHRQMLNVLGIPEAEKIVPSDEDLMPTDPVTENMAILTGKPVKAFMYQDHEAHLQTHLSMQNHPKIVELMGKLPQAQTVIATMSAHVADHIAMAYRYQIERELGVSLPDQELPIPEDIELRLSRLVAPAAEQLTGKAQQQKQAEENAKQQEDPIIQMAQKELRIKEETLKAKQQSSMDKLKVDLAKAQENIALKREQLNKQSNIEMGKLALNAANLKAKNALEKDKLTAKQQTDGLRIGLEFAENVVNQDEDQ